MSKCYTTIYDLTNPETGKFNPVDDATETTKIIMKLTSCLAEAVELVEGLHDAHLKAGMIEPALMCEQLLKPWKEVLNGRN